MTQVMMPAGTGRAQAPAAGQEARRGRDELTDALALLALTMIGIVGFRPAFGGTGYLVAGAAGIVIGLVLSYLGQRAGLPLLAVVTASVLAFLLLGGVVSQTGTVSVPTLQKISSAAVSGWQQLLTIGRPVGTSSGLLALPYLLGLFGGVAGHALAQRTRAVLLPAAAPAVIVALSILFGAPRPADAALQGAVFAAVALAWATVRQDRAYGGQATIGRQRPWQRLGAGAVVLAVAGAGAVLIGPHLPGAGAHKRVVLTVVPPFNVNQYPSPLAAFRDYTKDAPPSVNVYGKDLLATTGLPAGTLVRIATMDTYDGLAWGVANTVPVGTDLAGTFGGFQRVGSRLPGAPAGHASTATITVRPAYDQPWLPDLPGVTQFTGFTINGAPAGAPGCPGSDAGAGQPVAAQFRYDVATGTGIIPGGVPCGLTYSVSYVGTAEPSLATLAGDSPAGSPDSSIVLPAAVQGFASAHAQSASTPMGKVVALAGYLRENGRYSDGGGSQSAVAAGHSEGRLTTFLESAPIVGDDEQYAAAMALLANSVGVPARVSLDGAVERDGLVMGKDVRADVQLDTAEYGWVTLPAKDFTGSKPLTVRQQQVAPPQQPVKVIPPRQAQAAPVAAANQSNSVARDSATPPAGSGFAVPAIVVTVATDAGLPALAVAALIGALAAAKAARRRHRRRYGAPAARVAGAWRELTDLSRDLGIVLTAPGTTGNAAATGAVGTPTRREFAAYAEQHGLPSARAVADAADAATFGPDDPDGVAARRVWELVAAARRGATAPLPWWRRGWVAINPASLLAAWPSASRAARRALRAPRAPRGARAVTGGALR